MRDIQSFYDHMASQYEKLFLDWQITVKEQARILHTLFLDQGFSRTARILDCACGIGTQAIGLAALGYTITASDISAGALVEAKGHAAESGLNIRFEQADFCALSSTFTEKFDIAIAMDNALPHMLSRSALQATIASITAQLAPGGMFVSSIQDYDALLRDKPPTLPRISIRRGRSAGLFPDMGLGWRPLQADSVYH